MKNSFYFFYFIVLTGIQAELVRIALKKATSVTSISDSSNSENRSFFQKLQATVSNYNMKLENSHDMQYYGELQLGSQKKTFKIVFDTGSQWMFIPGAECETCVASKYFSCSESTSCVQSEQNSIVNVTYGKGFISGRETIDKVYLSDNMFVTQQKLLVVMYQRDFNGFAADGLCGLGVEGFYENEEFNIVNNLYKTGKISNQMFSFQLNREAYTDDENYSELLIGGYDNSSLEENMSFYRVVEIGES